jgi:hypothetical protein
VLCLFLQVALRHLIFFLLRGLPAVNCIIFLFDFLFRLFPLDKLAFHLPFLTLPLVYHVKFHLQRIVSDFTAFDWFCIIFAFYLPRRFHFPLRFKQCLIFTHYLKLIAITHWYVPQGWILDRII